MKSDKVRFTRISRNRKTGYIPVTTSEEASCPSSCPLKDKNICYAKKGKMKMTWQEVKTGINKRWNKPFNNDYDSLLKEIRRLPVGQYGDIIKLAILLTMAIMKLLILIN